MSEVKAKIRKDSIWYKMASNMVVPLIAVIIAMLVGAIFMVIIGAKPWLAYSVLAKSAFGSTKNFFGTLVNTTPLIFTGLSVAFAFRCGLFNIGGEGQFLAAYLAAGYVGAFMHMPAWLHVPVTLLAAMLAGAMWGAVPGLLKAKMGIHEVISTIMFNYIALYGVRILIRVYLMGNSPFPATPKIDKTAQLMRFSKVVRGTHLNISIFIALIVAIIIYWLLWKTTTGYEVRAVGYNSDAAQYGGISAAKNIILAMAISGALAGLAGASQVMGLELRANQPFGLIGLGFTGIAVALLGKNHPAGIVVAALLFGTLQRGANAMQSNAGVPKEVILIIQAIIIFFVASDYAVRKIYHRYKAKKEVAEA